MRPFRIGFALLSVVVVAFSACSTQAPECPTTGSGGGGGSPGVVPHCENISIGLPSDDICDICFHRECCAELARCAAAGETSEADASTVDHTLGNLCLLCGVGGQVNDPMCDPVAELARKLRLCSGFRCQSECFPGSIKPSTSSSGSGNSSSSSSSGSG